MQETTNIIGALSSESKVQSEPAILTRRIGSTTYQVVVRFSDTATETMNDKILRLIRSEALGTGVAS